jgi:methyl-accepting chemotaxis protein
MLKNFKLSARLGLGFGVILFLMIVIIGVVFVSMNSIQERLDKIVNENVYKLNLCQDMSESINTVAQVMRTIIILNDQAGRDAEYQKMEEARQRFDASWKALQETTATEQGKIIRADIETTMNTARPLNDRVVELAMADNDTEAARVLTEEAGPATQKWLDALDQNKKLQKENNEKDAQAAESAYVSTLVIMFILAGTSLAAGILIAVFLTRSITRPINHIVNGLNEGAQQVASASEQLSASSQQLAEGNAEQASSIEETSSTLEESASMVQQNSENTKQAAMLAGQTKLAADKGNGEMQEMLTSMGEIKKSSDQIAKIIKVIDEIAFQTNILALNAAVEAARAGDAGMGFAVVAEEVRNLAQRSAQAAKDTAAIIETNIELSEKGVNVAKKAGESLSEITIQAKKVNELMDEIAAASQEQTQGIGQINKAIAQMEKVTQMSASSAEECASSSEELSAQALNLKDIVQQLVKLVNGRSEQDSLSQGALSSNAGAYRSGASHTGPAALHPNDMHGVKAIDSHNKTAPYVNAPGYSPDTHKAGKKTQIVDPDEVIPLDHDRKDF